MVGKTDLILGNTLYGLYSNGKNLEFKDDRNAKGKVTSIKVRGLGLKSRNDVVKAAIAYTKDIQTIDLTFDQRIALLEYLKRNLVHEVPKEQRSMKLKISQFFGKIYNREKKLDEAIKSLEDARTQQELKVSRAVRNTVEKYIKTKFKNYEALTSVKVLEGTIPRLKQGVKSVVKPLRLSDVQLSNAIDGGIFEGAKILRGLSVESRRNLVETLRPKSRKKQNPDVEPEAKPRASLKIKKLTLKDTGLSATEQARFEKLWNRIAPEEDLPLTEGAFQRAYMKVAKKSLKNKNQANVIELLSLLEKIVGDEKAQSLMAEAQFNYNMRRARPKEE